MVITDEFKFPEPPARAKPRGKARGVERIDAIPPVLPVKRYWRKWQKSKDRQFVDRVDESLPDGVEKSLQISIDKVNSNLRKHDVPIHLALVRRNGAYELDVYDCSDRRICRLIRDHEVHLDDLMGLLRNLQEEAGILVDTVS